MGHDVISFALLALSAIFFVVDPPGAVPLFLAITAGDSAEKRARTARRACIVAAGTLIGFGLAGGAIFRLLGVSLPAFKTAGGILLLLAAIDMLRAKASSLKQTPEEKAEAVARDDVAVFPLGIPLLAGPGAIATVMMLMARAQSKAHVALVLFAILVTSAASYVLLRAAPKVDRVLGRTGNSILGRVMGLLLGAIAVQFIFDGVREAKLFG